MTRKAGLLVAALICGSVAVAACLVDIPDVVADGGGGDAGTKDSALPDVFIPLCNGVCQAGAGFAPVLFALDQNTTCPSGMTTLNAAADPGTPGGGACSCDCTITEQPTCLPQTITHDYDTDPDAAVCNKMGTATFVSDGGCTQTMTQVSVTDHWAVPPNPGTGTCTSNATSDPSKVPSTPSRLCIDTTCSSSVCTAPLGFQTCFVAPGALACPATMKAHQVGTVSVACSTCGGCAVGATCEGTLTLYFDNTCSVPLETVNVDGGCEPNTYPGTTIGSVKYSPTVVGTTCTAGVSGSPTVQLQQELTVCCP